MPAVRFQNVSKVYRGARGPLRALDGVSFDIEPGEFFGLLPIKRTTMEAAREELYVVLTRVAEKYRQDLLPSIERVWADTVAGINADLIEWLRLVGRDAEERGWEPAYFELSFGLPDRKESDENSQVEPVPLDCGLSLRGSI